MEEADAAVERPHKKKNDYKERHKLKASKRKNHVMREEIEKLKNIKTQLPEMTADDIVSFAKLPLSTKTLKGLKDAGFTVPTKVQRQSLLFSLSGCDVVAAAKTGSGKTLAFIIPILEKLYCSMWTNMDGLGALVITPARELAYQIFDVLNKVGKEHDFSAGLVIGGTDLTFEWKRVSTCNIMICTPGRLLQHMTENPDFACENVQLLVLDEADMCLSMGFADSVNCILEELPSDRQTLLFSATQTRDVKDLIRAGCQNPVFCSVHEHSKTTTPKALVENYVVCDTHDKFTFLWTFISSHKKQKILVFLSTCKQVKYIYNMFCKLQPGLCVMGLHGNMKQLKRMAVYEQFCRKKVGVLFATDVAARGLDIPAVHWVLQADCPEDVTTYIHRAGRTARYSMAGNGLLILTPAEEPVMVENLKAKNIPIQQTFIDAKRQHSISVKMEIVLTKYNSLKEDAVRAYKSYIKHIAQMKNKKVFNVLSIDLDAYARSLGLVVTPRLRFLEKALKQKYGDAYNKIKDQHASQGAMEKPRFTTLDFGTNNSDDDDDDDEFLTSSKNQPVPIDENLYANQVIPLSNKKKKRITKEDVAQKLLRKNIQCNQKYLFDDEGNVIYDPAKVQMSDAVPGQGKPRQSINIDELKEIMKEADAFDRKMHNAKIKEKKRERKRKAKDRRKEEMEEDEEEEEDEVEYNDDSADSDGVTQEYIDELPDPDKIYGKTSSKDKNNFEGDESDSDNDELSNTRISKQEGEGSESDGTDDYESTEKVSKISGKRKARLKAREAKRAKMTQGNTLSDLPIDEQEQLALFLLSGKK